MNKYSVPQDIWEVLASIKPLSWSDWHVVKLTTRASGAIHALFKEPKFFRPVYVEVVSEFNSSGERVTYYEVHR